MACFSLQKQVKSWSWLRDCADCNADWCKKTKLTSKPWQPCLMSLSSLEWCLQPSSWPSHMDLSVPKRRNYFKSTDSLLAFMRFTQDSITYLRSVFCNRHLLRLPIRCTSARIYQCLDTMCCHCLHNDKGVWCNVVIIPASLQWKLLGLSRRRCLKMACNRTPDTPQRFGRALTNISNSSKMHNSIKSILFEDCVHLM